MTGVQGRRTQTDGSMVSALSARESLLTGPSGQFAHLQSLWQFMENRQRRLTTVIPIGG